MLSEEEKKAIEWLKNKPDECTNIINSSSYIGNKKAYAKERANFKTVFNIITKLQKENEELKNKFEKELEDNRKNSCELLKQDLVIREKNKQIDLMSEYIYNTQMECNIYYKDKEEVKNKFAKM